MVEKTNNNNYDFNINIFIKLLRVIENFYNFEL